MDKKDILLIGGGLAVGVLIMFLINKNKSKSETSTGISAPTAEQLKMDKCKQDVTEYMKTVKIADNIMYANIFKEKYDACMSTGVVQ
jgi:hypothetical protein